MTKTCVRCKQTKDLDLFHKYSLSKDGLHYYCKVCKCEVERLLRVKYPLSKKKIHLKSLYDLSLEDFYSILSKQKGLCAICMKPERGLLNNKTKNLCVDHCHKTGKIRGLLCSNCNRGIGHLKEDKEIINNALRYLGYV